MIISFLKEALPLSLLQQQKESTGQGHSKNNQEKWQQKENTEQIGRPVHWRQSGHHEQKKETAKLN